MNDKVFLVKAMKKYSFFLILLLVFCGCKKEENMYKNEENNKGEEVDNTPNFQIQSEDFVIEEYETYCDKWKTIYSKKSVINTNPDTLVNDSILSKLSKYENEKVEKYDDENYTCEIALDINGNRLECTMFATEYSAPENIPQNRIEIINNYLKADMANLATTFSDVPDMVAVRPRVHEPYYCSIWQGDKKMGYDYVPIKYFNTLGEVPDNDIPTYLPDVYRLVYDRFNDRIYEGFDLNTSTVTKDVYRTEIKPGYLKDLPNYTKPNVIPNGWEEYYQNNQKYGIVYLYKNDELYKCGVITKYTEEWTEKNDSINYICCFTACGGENGNVTYMEYHFPGNSCFQIRELDYSKPRSDAEFTEVSNEYMYTNNDYKDGHPMTFGSRKIVTNLIK